MILEYKGIPIFYEDHGKGSAVVLLHGFLENSTMWKEIVPELSKTHRVITIDLLGHGKTECLGYIHSMETMAEAVYAVLRSLNLRRIILIGHSMGGYVALALTEKHPEMIKGLCLMNSTSLADDEERKKLRARANKMAQNNFNNIVRMSFTNLFGEGSKIRHKVEMENALKEALNTPVQGYIACQEGMRIRKNRRKILKDGAFKKLIVIGKKDPVLNFEQSLKEAEEAHSETAVFNDGHMSHIENKDELIFALTQFVRKC